MEQQDFTPIGGSWQQDAAYSLRQIIQQANELLIKVEETGNQISSAITESNSTIIDTINQQETTVEVTTYNYSNNRETLYVYNPLPIITPKPKQKVVYKQITVQPPTRVVDVNKQMAYSRICGNLLSSMNSDMINCKECVDRWLEAHKDGFELKDLTSAGTGCVIKSSKHSAVSSKCNPPSSILDRAAVKAYRECMQRSK